MFFFFTNIYLKTKRKNSKMIQNENQITQDLLKRLKENINEMRDLNEKGNVCDWLIQTFTRWLIQGIFELFYRDYGGINKNLGTIKFVKKIGNKFLIHSQRLYFIELRSRFIYLFLVDYYGHKVIIAFLFQKGSWFVRYEINIFYQIRRTCQKSCSNEVL